MFLFFVRERIYLYYACFVLLVTLHQVIWFGFGFEYLWPDYPGLNNQLDIFAGNGLFFFIGLFVMDFLGTKNQIPRIHMGLKLSTAAMGVSAVLVFILNRQLILGPTNNLTILQIVLLLTAGIFCFKKKLHHKIEQDMSEMFASNATMQGEYELRRKNGFCVPVFFYASPILSDNQPVGVRGVALDLSERKKTEEIMIQTEKMMSVGGFAAGMAHEINSPLAGMIQSAQVLQNRLTKSLPANDKAAEKLGTSMAVIRQFMEERGIVRLIDNITQSGFRASKIIRNMLNFAKKGDSVKRPCKLDKILDDTVELAQYDYNLKKKFDFKDIEIVREYSPDQPPVLCEQSKIQQVVFNLIKNASQAMDTPNSNQENDDPPIITLRLSKQFNWALIEIIDNGPGMEEETRNRIFEPFFTTKGLDKGTGLGLSVSYYIIVDDHGGEMNVDSEPGKGTAFSIRLPLYDVG